MYPGKKTSTYKHIFLNYQIKTTWFVGAKANVVKWWRSFLSYFFKLVVISWLRYIHSSLLITLQTSVELVDLMFKQFLLLKLLKDHVLKQRFSFKIFIFSYLPRCVHLGKKIWFPPLWIECYLLYVCKF